MKWTVTKLDGSKVNCDIPITFNQMNVLIDNRLIKDIPKGLNSKARKFLIEHFKLI